MIVPKILSGFSAASISRFQASSNYTIINHRNGKKLISSYSLKTFADLLDKDQFVRINRSLLVNVSLIKGIENTDGINCIRLSDDVTIPIPRRRNKELKKYYPSLFKYSNL